VHCYRSRLLRPLRLRLLSIHLLIVNIGIMRKPLQLHLRHYTLSRLFPFVSQPHCFCMSSDAAVLQDGEMRCPRGHHCVERGHRSAGGGARVQQRVRAPRRALRASHPRAHFCAGGLRATAGEREQARRQPRTHQGRVGSQTARGASRERERESERVTKKLRIFLIQLQYCGAQTFSHLCIYSLLLRTTCMPCFWQGVRLAIGRVGPLWWRTLDREN